MSIQIVIDITDSDFIVRKVPHRCSLLATSGVPMTTPKGLDDVGCEKVMLRRICDLEELLKRVIAEERG